MPNFTCNSICIYTTQEFCLWYLSQCPVLEGHGKLWTASSWCWLHVSIEMHEQPMQRVCHSSFLHLQYSCTAPLFMSLFMSNLFTNKTTWHQSFYVHFFISFTNMSYRIPNALLKNEMRSAKAIQWGKERGKHIASDLTIVESRKVKALLAAQAGTVMHLCSSDWGICWTLLSCWRGSSFLLLLLAKWVRFHRRI